MAGPVYPHPIKLINASHIKTLPGVHYNRLDDEHDFQSLHLINAK